MYNLLTIKLLGIIILGGWLKVLCIIYAKAKEEQNFTEEIKRYWNEGAFALATMYSLVVGVLLFFAGDLIPVFDFPVSISEALLIGISADVIFHSFLSSVIKNKTDTFIKKR